MNVVDLFCGAGGFSRGFVEEGFKITVAVDNFKPAVKTFENNFPESVVLAEDIKRVKGDDIIREGGDADVLIGSPPCEPFTPLNVRRYSRPSDRLYKDNAGRLVLHFVRLVRELKPKVFVMENVPGILELRKQLSQEFKRAGYEPVFNILRAEDYGCPSIRKRVFISNIELKPPHERRKRVIDAIGDLPPPNGDIPNHRFAKLPKKWLKKAEKLKWGEGIIRVKGNVKNVIRLHPFRLAPPVMGSSRFIHPFEVRLLTVREHARLMGFPDTHIFEGGQNSQYMMVGEAVPVSLSAVIAKEIKRLVR